MARITKKEVLGPGVGLLWVEAPWIAAKAQPGQFLVLRLHERGERIPLTIADFKPEEGEVALVYQEVGKTTQELGTLPVGAEILDILGPLGQPLAVKPQTGAVVCVSGGIGVAPMFPKARAHFALGNRVISLQGAQTESLLILRDWMARVSHVQRYSTDDGSFGHHGFVTEVLQELLNEGEPVAEVIAIGPLPMMQAVCEVTRPYGLKTWVSLNAIMVDGTGMCGSCRVMVAGKNLFSCVDGPIFDGHQVDFPELLGRQRRFLKEEKIALEKWQAERRSCLCHRNQAS